MILGELQKIKVIQISLTMLLGPNSTFFSRAEIFARWTKKVHCRHVRNACRLNIIVAKNDPWRSPKQKVNQICTISSVSQSLILSNSVKLKHLQDGQRKVHFGHVRSACKIKVIGAKNDPWRTPKKK